MQGRLSTLIKPSPITSAQTLHRRDRVVATGSGHAPCLDLAVSLTHTPALKEAAHVGGLNAQNAGDFIKFANRSLQGTNSEIKASRLADGSVTCHLVHNDDSNDWIHSQLKTEPKQILQMYKRSCNPPQYTK